MKVILYNLAYLSLVMMVISCSKDEKKDPILVEAFQVHEKSLSLAKDVKKLLDEIPVKDSTIIFFNQRFKNWEETVTEVPGFEHAHDHEHHHHHHTPDINLTPQQIFDIQMELQDSITAIREELILYTQSDSK